MSVEQLTKILTESLSPSILRTIEMIIKDTNEDLEYENVIMAIFGEGLEKFSISCKFVTVDKDIWFYKSTMVNFIAQKFYSLLNETDMERVVKNQFDDENSYIYIFIKQHTERAGKFVINFSPITKKDYKKIFNLNAKYIEIYKKYMNKIVKRMKQLGNAEEIKRIDNFAKTLSPEENCKDLYSMFNKFRKCYDCYKGVYIYLDYEVEDGIRALDILINADNTKFMTLTPHIFSCIYSTIVIHLKIKSINGIYGGYQYHEKNLT